MGRAEIERLIVSNEWEMFQQVKGIDGRAECQDEYQTFIVMRMSQFKSWPENVIVSYLQDLEAAKAKDRNLVMEKYAYMMAETDPEYYNSIQHLLPEISHAKRKLATEILGWYLIWEREVNEKYPNVRKNGRNVYQESLDGTTSFANYLYCELCTYSMKTLTMLLGAIENSRTVNRYKKSMELMAQAYGYASLEEAEKALA